MNILLFTSEFSPINGGIGTYAREMAAAATRLGARVTVIAPDYSKDLMSEDRSFPFRVLRFRGGLHSMRDLPSKIFLARESVRMGTYDVVHAADWPFFIPLALSRKRTHGRLLMTVHGTEINEMQTPVKRSAIRAARVFGPKVEVAANSEFTRDLFSVHFPVASHQVQAIRLGVSDFWFGSSNSRPATRAAYGLAPDRIVMVTVARLTRRKGHHLTLAALSALPEQLRKRISWLVVGPNGEAEYVAELHRLIASSGCDVRLLGALSNEQIRDIYGASDFFCLTGVPDPSGRVEGFGLVYLEAGASGLPSIATAIGGVPDAVLKDESGLLVQPSAAAITRAMAELAEDAGRRSILAAGATAHARLLSWERCAAETYRLPRPEGVKRDGAYLAEFLLGQERPGRIWNWQDDRMKQWALTIVFATLALNSAQAAGCNKSRDYLLGSLGGDLPESPQAYQALFKACVATTAMANVKDAFILKDGGIAVIAKQDTVAATAATLSTFCTAYPRGILRFLTRKELPQATSIGKVVQMSSTGATPCRKIMGNSSS